MKKVYLYFKEFELGFLTQKEEKFLWVPNSKNINECFSRYDGGVDMFMLDFRNDTLYNQIPSHFSEFLQASERNDIIKQARINNGDSDFDKLCKIATLKFLNQDFYVSI